MLLFQWDKKLELGVEIIDQQHRQVIECINTFFIRRKCKQGQASVSNCVSFLNQYILYHFQTEEAFQMKSDYPAYRQHQAKHAALATQVKFFTVRLQSADFDEEVVQEFYEFLVEWVQQHVMVDDFDFITYYKNHKDAQKITDLLPAELPAEPPPIPLG